jgi:hypothetical protein
VAQASGLPRKHGHHGADERGGGSRAVGSVRQQAPGAGDEPAIDNQPGLFRALDKFVLPATADVGGYLGR